MTGISVVFPAYTEEMNIVPTMFTHNAMDYRFDLRDLPKLLEHCGEADIVSAARMSRPGYNFVQLYSRSVWEAIQVEARNAAFVTPEAMIRAHDLGYRVKEVAIEYHPHPAGEATSGNLKVILHSLRDMFSFWWKRLLRRTSQLPDTRTQL